MNGKIKQTSSVAPEHPRQRNTRDALIGHFQNLAQTGIGTPPETLMAQPYGELLLYDVKHPDLINAIARAVDCRSETDRPIKPHHMSFVFVYAINYLMMFERGLEDYPETYGLFEPKNWQQLYHEIENDPVLFTKLQELLQEKELITSVPQRGNDLRFILKRVFGDTQAQPIDVVDLGSSFGMPFLSAMRDVGDEFPKFIDDTEYDGQKGLINAERNTPLGVRNLFLIDHTFPFDYKKWFLSCRYPGDAIPRCVAKSKAMIDRYKWTDKVRFIERDMLNPAITPESVNVVAAIKSGYELGETDQARLVSTVMPGLIKGGGLMIVKDNVVINPKTGQLEFTTERDQYSCVTAVRGAVTGEKWMIVMEHKTGRCDQTRNGPDLDVFMKATAELTHNK